MSNLLITGAGVDRTQGLNFPLANTLLADVTRYLDTDGQDVEKALRSMLPGLKFNFNKMIANAVDKIATRDESQQRQMMERVQAVVASLPPEKENVKNLGELLLRLFNKLIVIASENFLDDETEALIRLVFPHDTDEMIDSDSILDIHKLSLSDTFKIILKKALKLSLSTETNEVAAALGADMLNIETLLIEKFLGFYNESQADIKNYIYISWALWAYLVDKQKRVLTQHSGQTLPFYGSLPEGFRAITLNYTAFLQERYGSEDTIYFHGGLAEYVRMDTRDLLPIEDILSCDPASFIREVISPNINVSDKDIRLQKHVIPALVPPLRLKPILSHKYINLWSNASNWVRDAQRIIVIGYSFNSADEHFNDILRTHSDKKIYIIAPDAITAPYMDRIEKVFGIALNQYSTVRICEKEAKKARNIYLISAYANDINLSQLPQ